MSDPDINQEKFDQVAALIAENDLEERQPERTRAEFETVYDITPATAEGNVQKLFEIVIQTRAVTIGERRYRELADNFDPEKFLAHDSHEHAFHYLLAMDDVGQKISNEFLRQVVHVMGVREDWLNHLHVPLDVHVVQGLVKTGCITGVDSPLDVSVPDVVNTEVSADPHTRIGYRELQNAMDVAADEYDLPRIVFDELWLENRYYLTKTFLQKESFLVDDDLLDGSR